MPILALAGANKTISDQVDSDGYFLQKVLAINSQAAVHSDGSVTLSETTNYELTSGYPAQHFGRTMVVQTDTQGVYLAMLNSVGSISSDEHSNTLPGHPSSKLLIQHPQQVATFQNYYKSL